MSIDNPAILNRKNTEGTKSVVVWDTSLCNLEYSEIKSLLEDTTKINLFTSITFDELEKLSEKNYHDADAWTAKAVKNANLLIYYILKDSNSTYSNIVVLKKNGYVDSTLLSLCIKNKYELYTYDYSFGLRAKSCNVKVTIFNNISIAKNTSKYSPDPTGQSIILSTDIIDNENCTIEDIITTANSINGGKFIITPDFAVNLDKHKHKHFDRIRKIINFFVADVENKYSLFISDADAKLSIGELSKKYQSKIFTSDFHTALDFKACSYEYEVLFNSKYFRKIKEITEEFHKTNNSSANTTVKEKYSTLPFYSVQHGGIKLKNLKTYGNVLVLDSEKKPKVIPENADYFKIHSNETVIFLTFKNELFKIEAYIIQNCQNNSNNSILQYSNVFSIDEINTLPVEYIKYVIEMLE